MFQPKVATRDKIFVLIPGCLIFILTTVVLMNLQAPVGQGSDPFTAGNNFALVEASHTPEPHTETATSEDKNLSEVKNTKPDSERRPAPPNLPSIAVGAIGVPVNDADLEYLRQRNLLIPVSGITAKDLRDSFDAPRSEGRLHRAVDIMASRGTPVVAAADGKLKLHTSDKGGLMIYQTDSSGPYVYCYGHLQQYADGIHDGKEVRGGEIIGYVGDTGNAGPGNYHLHFAISKMRAPGKWSGGEAINPYPLLGGVAN